jgi:hypothetical protein
MKTHKNNNQHAEETTAKRTNLATDKNQPLTSTGRKLKPLTVPQLDPDKVKVQFCPASKAEMIAKQVVLRDLRQRAKSAGKKITGGTENIAGPERCQDLRWLFRTLAKIRSEFGVTIDEHLRKLAEPDADREMLAGRIYTDILLIRATKTIFFGD